MQYSNKALAWDKFYESIAEPEVIEDDTEENYSLREKMIRILKEMDSKATATIVWNIEDIQSLRPNWSTAKCSDWLSDNANGIVDRSVELGWEVIEALLWHSEIKEND